MEINKGMEFWNDLKIRLYMKVKKIEFLPTKINLLNFMKISKNKIYIIKGNWSNNLYEG